jgi:tetratricopeptide (TPR) repeat protein
VRARNLWPLPLLGLATAMLVGGLVIAVVNRPKPPASLPLDVALEAVRDEKYEDAIDLLKGQGVQRFLASAEADDRSRARFFLARARSIFEAQASKGISVAANYRTVVEDYQRAEELMRSAEALHTGEGDGAAGHGDGAHGAGEHGAGAHGAGEHGGRGEGGGGVWFEAADSTRLAESLLALGEVDRALKVAQSLPAAEQARKTRLIRRIVEHNLAGPDRREAMTIDLLASLSADPELSSGDRAWVLARQAELLIGAGQAQEAIGRLVRRIGLLRDVPAEQQGELYLLLARAYFLDEQSPAALKQLDAADGLIDRTSPLRALMGVMQGQIAQAAGDLERARERFMSVTGEFAASRYYPLALLGLAEVEAASGVRDADAGDREALERYSELVELVKRAGGGGAGGERGGAGPIGAVDTPRVLASLMQRASERFDSGARESALRYALLAESLFKDPEVPAELLKMIGRTHRAMGDSVLEQAGAMAPAGEPAPGVADLDATTQAEVRKHYTLAGEYLRRHAVSVAATDTGAYAESLWTAADSFDLAGELDEARKAFAQYADGASDNDPMRPAARFRLAQVFQAQGDFASAAGIYRQLVQGRGAPGAPGSAGRWADAAMVPLARCLLADKDTANDAEAERMLLGVVDGSTLTPDAAAYREALVELGAVYYATQRYADAIGWLEQAIKRYKDDPRVEGVRYRLADSHRLEAARIERALEQTMPQTQADELARTRAAHLADARRLFGEVRANLETKGGDGGRRRLDELERVHLRNAYFYIGDCAMDLGDYEGAIAAYDAARLRYADDPASLVAMSQIVSAYVAQKQWAQARTANERARQQLARFPDSVWSRPDLPMEKRHWEQWLEARTALEQAAGAEGDRAE